MAVPQSRRGLQSSDVDYDIAEEEEYYVTRPHTSVRRYRQPAQRDTLDDHALEQVTFVRRRSSNSTPGTVTPGAPSLSGMRTARGNGIATKAIDPATSALPFHRRRAPWLAIVGGMVVTLIMVVGFSSFNSWWQLHQNDATYGRPRTYQTDAVVGHQDSASKPSHFIFINLLHHVTIIEFPGGDTTHAIIYSGPTLFEDGSDLFPVTGEFHDVNGDGRSDMIVHVQDQTIVFINDGTKFRSLQPGEHISL